MSSETLVIPGSVSDERAEYMGRPVMKFVLLVNQHIGFDENYDKRQWRQGQRIATRTNLAKRFPQKFQRISDGDNTDPGERFYALGYNPGEQNNDDAQDWMPDAKDLRDAESRRLAEKIASTPPKRDDAKHSATLNEMSLDDLVKMCQEEEIELGTGKLVKKEVIAKIIQHDNLASMGNQ